MLRPTASLREPAMNLGNRGLVVVGRFVEEVVGRVRHKRLMTDVCWQGTARRWCEPSRSVQPLDEGGLRQRVATSWSDFGSNRLEQEPGYGIRRDDSRVAGLHLAPDGARVPRVLPCGANRAVLKRVGAEVVGDELLSIVLELE